MLNRIAERLALTKTERTIILFLCGTFTAGLGLRYYQEVFPNAPQFDYRKSDSTFAALSEQIAREDSSAVTTDSEDEVLNLNTATKSQLMKLPGVGQVTAERILQYRDEHNGFASLDDLKRIKGISDKKLEKLKPLLTLH